MNIIQITDLHIGKVGEIPNEIDVRQNFLKILEEAKKAAPDMLVLTGDLCLNLGEVAIYEWIKKLLDDSAIPYEIIAGNHDDSKMMAQVFGKTVHLNGHELFFQREIGGKTCLFLDTAIGEISEDQLIFLKKALAKTNKEVVIFMHHPVVDAGVVFMERRYAMRGRAAIQEILFDFGLPVSVFCGHYHIERTIAIKNITMYITPSCYLQIDMKAEDFKVAHHRIAFREIDLQAGMVSSSVHYFEGAVFLT